MPLIDPQCNQLELLKNGDEKIFEYIFHAHFQSLYYFSKKFVIRDSIAKELVQESFLTLWEKRSELRPNTNIKAYLFTLTRNNSLNYLKHLKIESAHREQSKREGLELQLNEIALEFDGSDLYVAKELQSKIEESINTLPKQCKRVFQLSRFDNLKYKEIAENLNISIKTVENQMTKALRHLRSELKNYLN